jgi:hypothetical protein
MNGYGEFFWKDGKRYAGFYRDDKKSGFGIYYWSNPNKLYIGFWKYGKQEGIGKYISEDRVKYGLWKNGVKVKWFNNGEEGFQLLNPEERRYIPIITQTADEIKKFVNLVI